MTYTRLTVIGSARRADLVVPDDEPLAALVPDLLDLLGEGAGFDGSSVALVRRTGEQVELAATAAESRLPHGEVLRIVRTEEAPPPPQVADVTDVVAESLERRPDRWNATARRATAATAVAIASALLGFAAATGMPGPALAGLASAWGLAIAAAVVFGLLGHAWTRTWTTTVAFGISAPLAVTLERASTVDLPALLVGLVLAWTALGVGLGLAARAAAPAWAGLVGAGGAAAWLALSLTPLPSASVPAVIALAAVVAIGLLPAFALSASGLARLDDAAIAGSLPSRGAVAASLDDAYAELGWAGAALSVLAGAAGVALAASGDLYATLLAAAVASILALRTRQFPLIVHVVPLWAAAVAVLVGLALSPLLTPAAGAAVLGAVLVAAILLAGVRPAAHARVRLRRVGNLVEMVAVVATVPMLLGTLGLYPDLLAVFP